MKDGGNIIELQHINKCYVKDVHVIQDFNLDVKKGEFVTFLGPSGCGKTTILRMIGGFDTPTSGRILLHGEDISKLPPNKRPINTVFQKYALFPHYNIYENIAFGLKLRKMPKDVIAQKVKRALEIVDLEGFEKRKITTLSGGQQQRVAIARAIVNEPEILLLDEPLGALDYKMRMEMQLELKLMHEELGITFIYVTHDQEEALTMSDRIVVISDGQIQQAGTPEEIYHRPSNVFVADFIGVSNIFDGFMTGDKKVVFCDAEFGCQQEYPAGTKIDAVVRPENVILTECDKGSLQGKVISSIFKGTYYEITVLSGKNEILAKSDCKREKGQKLGVVMKPQGIHVIPYDTTINHYEGVVDDAMHIQFEDGFFTPDMEKLYPDSTIVEGVLYSAQKKALAVEGVHVSASFEPGDARLSDNPDDGQVRGHIVSIIYMGDHYRYIVRSSSERDYYVNDEWLWNIGDYVSVVIPEDKIMYRLL